MNYVNQQECDKCKKIFERDKNKIDLAQLFLPLARQPDAFFGMVRTAALCASCQDKLMDNFNNFMGTAL